MFTRMTKGCTVVARLRSCRVERVERRCRASRRMRGSAKFVAKPDATSGRSKPKRDSSSEERSMHNRTSTAQTPLGMTSRGRLASTGREKRERAVRQGRSARSANSWPQEMRRPFEVQGKRAAAVQEAQPRVATLAERTASEGGPYKCHPQANTDPREIPRLRRLRSE
jgi:hypothetical protein